MEPTASIELLKKMLGIYSPSGKERELASFLDEELIRLGFKRVWTDKVGNVYGEIGLGSPTLLLCGHMDTVPGWIPIKIEDKKIYGRGAADAKSPLAAMISAASSFKPNIEKYKIIVACVVEEEKKAKGIRQLIHEDLSIDYAIFGEPSGVKNITFAYKGKLGLKITCKTVSGHVGAQHLLNNAIEKAFELWNLLKASCEKYKLPTSVFYSLIPCLTGVSSRRTFGGVPDICILEVDLRLPPTVGCEESLDLVKEVVNSFQIENKEVLASLKVTDKVEPFVADRGTLVIKALTEAIGETTGEPAKFLRKTGTGDMNIFGAETKIPVITYGPGDARLSHTPNEYIGISEYLAGIQVYKRAIERIFSSK